MDCIFETQRGRHPQNTAAMIIVGSNAVAVPTLRVLDQACLLTRLGRLCYKAQMARIAFYVSEQEFKEIAKLAGDVPLSKWCRRKLMERIAVPVHEQAGQDRKKRLPRAETISVVSGGAPVSDGVPASSGLCEHGAEFHRCKKWGCKNYEFAR